MKMAFQDFGEKPKIKFAKHVRTARFPTDL